MVAGHRSVIRHAALLWLLSLPLAAGWTCVSGRGREVCTDGSERRAQQVFEELIRLETAWSARHGSNPGGAEAIRVMLYRNRSDFRFYQSYASNLGFYQSGADRDWLMVLDAGDDPIRSVRHEWVHRALHHSTAALPLWLEEGLAEYWSTLEAQGGTAVIGRPPESRVRLLSRASWLPAEEFWTAGKTSRFYRSEELAGVFYSQAWAVVHLLSLHPGWRGKLGDYMTMLGAGQEPIAAFRNLWGREPAQAVAAAREWVASGSPGTETISLPQVPKIDMRTRRMDEADGLLLKAEALLAHNQPEPAKVLIDDAARRGRLAPAARGFVALQSGDKPAALALFEQAIAQGDRRGSVMLERAMLLRETGARPEQVREALLSALASNPELAEGWHLLSNLEAARGDAVAAIQAAEKAVVILPRQSIFWSSLGRNYLSFGRTADASTAADRALQSAVNANERALAEGLRKEIASWRPPPPPKSEQPWYHVPEGWQGPKPDASLSGRLVDVNCSGKLLLFTIETAPKQRTVLRAADPSRILLRQQGGEKREFVCGPQKPVLLVDAGYHAEADTAVKSAGILVVLAIKGAEPPPVSPPKAKAPAKTKPARKK